MSRYHRAYISGGVYFFTVVTHDRDPIFINEARVEILRKAFRKVMVDRPFQIDAMVVLPEHLHCLWRMPEGDADFSSRWREIKKAASGQIDTATNKHHERLVWQRRFWEHASRDEDDWRKHVDYIHYKPGEARVDESARRLAMVVVYQGRGQGVVRRVVGCRRADND